MKLNIEEKRVEYPVLMERVDSGLVVMFINVHTGIVIIPSPKLDYEKGWVSDEWEYPFGDSWKPYNGSLVVTSPTIHQTPALFESRNEPGLIALFDRDKNGVVVKRSSDKDRHRIGDVVSTVPINVWDCCDWKIFMGKLTLEN